MSVIEYAVAERCRFADGMTFGSVGCYERLTGRATFAADPRGEAQQAVVDIALAPVDAEWAGAVRGGFLHSAPR